MENEGAGLGARPLHFDPDARTLEVLRLESGRWTILATHAGNEVARAEPFADIELEPPALWA